MLFLIVATEKETGKNVFCQRPYMHGEYSFASTYTLSGRPSKAKWQRKHATEFEGADAIATLEKIENNLAAQRDKSWLSDWRIVPVDAIPNVEA